MKFSQKCIRIFGGCILFFTFALAFVTVAMAVSGRWDAGGSYSLVIQKQFDGDLPQDLLDQAKEKTYRFRVEGYRLDKDKNKIQVNEIVSIGPTSEDLTEKTGDDVVPWKKSETLSSDGPIHVSVTEITNDVTLNDGIREYNMGDSRAEVANLYMESPQVRDLNSNGKIILSRPEKKMVYVNGTLKEQPVNTTSVFRIRHEWPWAANKVVKPGNWKQMEDKEVTLAPGSQFEYTGLPAGRYTIEDLSVSGYKIKLGSRTGDVAAGETGEFYINSKPGRLTITAGGTENDGGQHYFTIRRVEAPDGAEPFEDRITQAVASGGRYEVTNLPRGRYKVTEYTFSNAPTRFKVKVPETEEESKSFRFKDLTEQGKTITRYYIPMGGDYVDGFRYGPMYGKNGKMLSASDLYDIRYIADFLQEDGTTAREAYKATNRKGSYYYTLNDTIIPGSGSQRLAFGVGETAANKGGYCLLKWTEHTRTEKVYEINDNDEKVDHTFTVDERGWMEITAPAVSPDDIGTENVTYTYTLRKSKSGPAVKTLVLKPGEAGRIEGLDAGSYFLRETVNLDQPDGFLMEISGDPFGSTEAGTSFDLVTMGDRMLTITKPTASDGGRDYTFTVERTGGKELETPFETKTVTLKAGESKDCFVLPEGKYRVTPTDDMTEVFQLICSDSTQVHAEVPSGQSSTVTFTNVFTPGKLGYRYVHEYYLKEEGEDKYSYEGCSQVTTVGGREQNWEKYGSVDVTKEPDFSFTTTDGQEQTYSYAYMPENNGYGYVDNRQQRAAARSGTGGTDGLRLTNQSTDKSDNKSISYKVDDALTGQKYIGVDEEKSQIIILRYFRVLPENQKGKYKYVHVYYLRNKDGTVTWEGTSCIQEVHGQLGLSYKATNVSLVPDYKPAGQNTTYHYVHNNRPTCGTLANDPKDTNASLIEGMVTNHPDAQQRYYPNSNGDSVVATEDGKQIVILRYYREEDAVETNGTYKVVHEYYFREKLEDQEGAEEDSGSEGGGSTDASLPSETDSGTGEAPTAAPSTEADAGDSPGGDPSGTEPGTVPPESGAGGNSAAATTAGDEGSGALDTQPGDSTAGVRALTAGEESSIAPADTLPAEEERVKAPADIPPTEEESSIAPTDTLPAEEESSTAPMDTLPAEKESSIAPTDIPSASDESGSVPTDTQPSEDGDTGGSGQPSEDSEGDFSFAGTLSGGDGYAYTFEGARTVETVSAPLGSPHRGEDVTKQNIWVPEGTQTRYGYLYLDAVYGNSGEDNRYGHISDMEWAASTQEGDQIIILRYYRDADTPSIPDTGDDGDDTDYGYRVVHEYYLEGADGSRTLEGRTEVVRESGSDTRRYDQSDVTKLPEYEGKTYIYTEDAYGVWSGGQEYGPEAGKTYVTATAKGEQIIILRYVRKDSPENPDDPKNPAEPGNPTDPEKPGRPGEPEKPEKPGSPGEPESPRNPGESGRQPADPSKTPERSPLDQVPPTGDTGSAGLWAALAAVSLCGLAVLLQDRKKTRKNKL